MRTVSDELPSLCSRHCRILLAIVLFLVGHVLWIIHVIISGTVTAYFQQCYAVCRETVIAMHYNDAH